ncbi:MAG: META domain-containing protein [Cyanobacteria bacterium]|nr:META domain-containing protein [Cyanobacteria bacterium CG_2015-16_32_12]NCO77870.1 META domain-containing protein [Cyanobacteria bacterium CG_2015-22_32_23]NCQ03067.1 META domain-containing protein [Cyanobacteria bacterium CG_2015-09_32_10]NCQ41968.1 META domain-containing protein [Cyanobacteria bacterium CG_2015-04_32_10]NCS84820.1 META domain-containing protein [Cyanobacteria bacterium CG_2015-02_32_10]
MKNKSLIISLALLTTFSFYSYIKPSQADMKMESDKPTMIENMGDTSANSLDWNGVYQGIIPCASCEGIKTTLTLNEDLSYVLSTQYLGKSEEVFEVKGTFKWNKEGNTITLDGVKDAPNQFFVGENTLIQLDISGNRISGDLAEKYMLNKVNNPEVSIGNTRWELVEIMGKPVMKSETQKQAIFITFDTQKNRVNGFSGCNNFMGGFEIKEGNRITLTQMASTMMACENMEMEMTFLQTLQQVDNYAMKDNVLSLNRAKMSPLLKFTAVKKFQE